MGRTGHSDCLAGRGMGGREEIRVVLRLLADLGRMKSLDIAV